MERTLLDHLASMLPENPTNAEIEKAYRVLAQLYHPDQNPNRIEWANEKMKQLNAAKAVLLDPLKKTAYIQSIKNQQAREKQQLSQAENLQRENLALRRSLGVAQKRNEITDLATVLLLLIGAAVAFKD